MNVLHIMRRSVGPGDGKRVNSVQGAKSKKEALIILHQYGVEWCNSNRGDSRMPTERLGPVKIEMASTRRASISFPSPLYCELEVLAQQKRVSLAWIVREAAERYVAGQVTHMRGRHEA